MITKQQTRQRTTPHCPYCRESILSEPQSQVVEWERSQGNVLHEVCGVESGFPLQRLEKTAEQYVAELYSMGTTCAASLRLEDVNRNGLPPEDTPTVQQEPERAALSSRVPRQKRFLYALGAYTLALPLQMMRGGATGFEQRGWTLGERCVRLWNALPYVSPPLMAALWYPPFGDMPTLLKRTAAAVTAGLITYLLAAYARDGNQEIREITREETSLENLRQTVRDYRSGSRRTGGHGPYRSDVDRWEQELHERERALEDRVGNL